MHKTATLSACERFRYLLGRRWGDGPPLLYVMLNPSTADADIDDPTIRRCIGFARAHGYPALEVVNLFAFRATKPAAMRMARYPVGDDNDEHIIAAARRADRVCVAWGSNGCQPEVAARVQVVMPLLRRAGHEPQCLAITKTGHPGHPLMLRSACRLHEYSLDAIQAAMRA
jgi:hypothetical protein